jgi:hypothetical protein
MERRASQTVDAEGRGSRQCQTVVREKDWVVKSEQTHVARNSQNIVMENPWFRIGLDTWLLGVEASSVIGLRTLKIAAGGAAAVRESLLMIDEKIDAGWALQAQALSGALGSTPLGATAGTLAHYRRKVCANRTRLAR